MTLIATGKHTYEIEYIKFYKVNTSEHTAEKDSKYVQADSPEQALGIMRKTLLAYHERDTRWSYQMLQHSIRQLDTN